MNGEAAPVVLWLGRHHQKERGDEAETREAAAPVEGDGTVRGDGGGSRRSSVSGEVCARLREAMAAPVGGKRGRGPGRLYLWRGGAARCVEEGARRGRRRHGGDGDGVVARDSVPSSGRAAWASWAGPRPGRGWDGPVGERIFFPEN